MDTFYKSIDRITSLSDITNETIDLVYLEPGYWIAHRISMICMEAPISALHAFFIRFPSQSGEALAYIICNHTSRLPNGFRMKKLLRESFELVRGTEVIVKFYIEKGAYRISCDPIHINESASQSKTVFVNLYREWLIKQHQYRYYKTKAHR